MKKKLFLLVLLTLAPYSGGNLLAQSKFLFNPGMHVDNPFKNEITGGAIIAGLEYRPKSFFGVEARAKLGFYGFKADLYPAPMGLSGYVQPNGFIHYRFNSPQIAFAPRFYKDLEIFADGLSVYVETELTIGVMNGDIKITGDTEFDNTFSDPVSFYSISIGVEQWIDRKHMKARDIIIGASVSFCSWNLKKPFDKYVPDSYNGQKPLVDSTLRLFITFKIPIGTK